MSENAKVLDALINGDTSRVQIILARPVSASESEIEPAGENMAIEPGTQTECVPIFSDDWKFKSDAEKRRWAFEKLDCFRSLTSTYDDRPSDNELFQKADRLVAYINGPQSGSAQSLSDVPPAAVDSAGMPYRPLREAI